jgi:hypothetical protein
MKILKYILFGIFGFITAILVIAAFMPKNYSVSVTETINKPKTFVFDYIKMFGTQTQYSEWMRPDPGLVPEITGTDGTVGAICKWNSKDDNVGQGQQTIAAISPDKIDIEIKFIRPMAGDAKVSQILSEVSADKTLVTTTFYSESKWPFNLPAILFGKGIIEETSLKNLRNVKEILEN